MYALVLIGGLFIIFIGYVTVMDILEKISEQLNKDIERLNCEIDDLFERIDKESIGEKI